MTLYHFVILLAIVAIFGYLYNKYRNYRDNKLNNNITKPEKISQEKINNITLKQSETANEIKKETEEANIVKNRLSEIINNSNIEINNTLNTNHTIEETDNKIKEEWKKI